VYSLSVYHTQEKGDKSMGKPEFSDYVWVARSGIQKAIRRSNAVLLEDCFDAVYSVDRDFIARRASVFAGEECWPLISQVMKFAKMSYDLAKKGSTVEQRNKSRDYLRAACRLVCMAEKDKDAAALASFSYNEQLRAMLHLNDDLRKEQLSMYDLYYKRCAGGEAREVWKELTELVYKLSNDELNIATGFAKQRYFMKGMTNEEAKFLAIPILILTEHRDGLPVCELNMKLKFKGSGRETLPLYAFDQHTRIGKTALYRAAKSIGTTYEKIAPLWFTLVAAKVSPERPGTFWWPERVRLVLESLGGEKKWLEKYAKAIVHEIQKRVRESGMSLRKG
jgi:hypothetical protein